MKIEIEENYITVDGVKYVPDVKKELQSGKWYVGYHYADRFLACITLTDEIETHDKGYGFNKYGWCPELSFLKTFDYGFEEATEQEVFEALKNEAVKRYKIGNHVKSFFHKGNPILEIKELDFGLNNQKGINCIGTTYLMPVVFENGQWAEIIPVITKQEAEALLSKKIV